MKQDEYSLLSLPFEQVQDHNKARILTSLAWLLEPELATTMYYIS